jgi:hypothetical protein
MSIDSVTVGSSPSGTFATMMPIAEYGKGQGHEYGKPCPEYDDQVAYGRGYVQLTWDYNYEKADQKCSLDGALPKPSLIGQRCDAGEARQQHQLLPSTPRALHLQQGDSRFV